MSNGRLEKETIAFAKIEEKLKTLPKILTDYYYTMRAEKKSYRTIGEYITSIAAFMTNTTGKSEEFYKAVTAMDINRYMISLETRKVNGRTKPTSSSYRATQWYAINSFFEFLNDTGRINGNPVPKKSRPKITDNASVTYLTEDEIRSIIWSIKEKAPENIMNRNLCMFIMGITTGLRISAILQINMEDIDFEKSVIHVVEKRNKTFDVVIGKKTKKILKDWIADRNKYFKDVRTNALFITQYGDRMGYKTAQRMLETYSELVNKKVTPHVMRHTCATNLYEKTGDIYLTATQLHHSSVTVTQRYANVSNRKMKQAASLLDDMI